MSLFSDALDWTADWVDTTFFGSTPGTTGPAGTLVDWGGQAVDAIQTLAPAIKAGGFLDDNYESFQAPQLSAPTGYAKSANSGISGNFSAGKTQGMQNVGVSDSRVRDAWGKVRNSRNPGIAAAVNAIQPTIRRTGPTANLTSATISRKKV